MKQSGRAWCTPVNPSTREVEVGGLKVSVSTGSNTTIATNFLKMFSFNTPSQK
jgi:hypothetical protein